MESWSRGVVESWSRRMRHGARSIRLRGRYGPCGTNRNGEWRRSSDHPSPRRSNPYVTARLYPRTATATIVVGYDIEIRFASDWEHENGVASRAVTCELVFVFIWSFRLKGRNVDKETTYLRTEDRIPERPRSFVILYTRSRMATMT